MDSLSATPAFKTELDAAEPAQELAPAPLASPWAADDAVAQPQPSPARALQHELARRLQTDDQAPRWSPRRTLLFVLVTCGAFWAVTAAVVVRLLH